MDFKINVDKQLLGKIVITDNTYANGGYTAENAPIPNASTSGEDARNYFKYSETVSVNTITKVTISGSTLIDVLLNEHIINGVALDDIFEFVAETDGYYVIHHFVIPTATWLNNNLYAAYASNDANLVGCIYYMDASTGTLYKRVYKAGGWDVAQEASIKELIEANLTNASVKSYKLDIFYDGYLKQCYIERALELFDNYMKGCTPDCKPKNVDTFPRDFLHMSLHIIHYLIGMNQYMEALRILELITHCGGFCKNKNNGHSDCGCSLRREPCGCSQA